MKFSQATSRTGFQVSKLMLLALLTLVFQRPAQAIIVYDQPLGNTTQPPDDIRWNSVVGWQNTGGTVIAPNYFLTAQHVGFTANGTVTLKTNIGGNVQTNTFTADSFTDVAGTDLRVVHITGTFPNAAIAPLYQDPAGSEAGQGVSLVGYGFHEHGAAEAPPGNTNGWDWGGASGLSAGKSFGTNTIDVVSPSAVGGFAPGLLFDFSPTAGEGIYADKDSGGGAFINVGGNWELAGVTYGVTQFFIRSGNSPNFTYTPISAAIHDGTGLYVQISDNPPTYVAAPDGFSQQGVASEIAPYLGQINDIIGVPEPSRLILGLLGAGTILLGKSLQWLRRRSGK